MGRHTIARRPLSPTIGLVDLIYATPWVVGALFLHDIPQLVTAVFVPVFVASWWQDWRSARAATSYFSAELVGFDVLTAGNYIGLVSSWRHPVADGELVSTETLSHWTAVFVIYIVWNLALMREADAPTRRAFAWFCLAETPIALIGFGLIAARVLDWHEPVWAQSAGVVALAVAHVALLVLWRVMSRRGNG